jgi:hypothetical protein
MKWILLFTILILRSPSILGQGFILPWQNLSKDSTLSPPWDGKTLGQVLLSNGELKKPFPGRAPLGVIPAFWEDGLSLSLVHLETDDLLGFVSVKKDLKSSPESLAQEFYLSLDKTPPPQDLSALQISWHSIPEQRLKDHLIRWQLLKDGFEVKSDLALEDQLKILKQLKRPIQTTGKATRILLGYWDHSDTIEKVAMVQGIFGETLGDPLRVQWRDFSSLDTQLKGILDQEKKLLTHNSPAKVIKIRGAWAYLDKGRSWGLLMEDRLISPKSQGHIVGFFGPEEKMVHLDQKTPVYEGAILYIRKGQRQVALGDDFIYDIKEFPTPWPP